MESQGSFEHTSVEPAADGSDNYLGSEEAAHGIENSPVLFVDCVDSDNMNGCQEISWGPHV